MKKTMIVVRDPVKKKKMKMKLKVKDKTKRRIIMRRRNSRRYGKRIHQVKMKTSHV